MQINDFFNLTQIKSFKFGGNIPSICFISFSLLERSMDFKAPTYFPVCFSTTFPKGEYGNLGFSNFFLRLEDNTYSTERYSYLSIFPDDNADIFAASQLISYCSFSSLSLSSTVMISFNILSKRFFLKCEELFDERVAQITKKKWFCRTFL